MEEFVITARTALVAGVVPPSPPVECRALTVTVPSLNFLCTTCEARLGREAGEPARPCESCGAENSAIAPAAGSIVDRCASCGHDELYFQKDFNRRTGIALVVLGSVFVPWTYGLSLLGVTVLDYIVWRIVKDVIVCYECQAVHRGYPPNPALKPFDLITHDRHVYGAAPPGALEGHRGDGGL